MSNLMKTRKHQAGELVFVTANGMSSETAPRDVVIGPISEEAKIALHRASTMLQNEGLSFRDVVKASCYVSDEEYRMNVIGVFKEQFAPGPFPSRVTFMVGLLANARFQLDLVAVRP